MEDANHELRRAIISFNKSGEIESYTIVAGNPKDEELVRGSLNRLLQPRILDQLKGIFRR